ncbi:MAG: helix-turn-helix domain-containing protein [Pseudodesulfovibrio sp.]|nr:helix-turn-helix domain-containing protein [Pseudodesulfovibrio sp.]
MHQGSLFTALPQADAILTHMRSGKTITQFEALNKYGCMRLASRIHDLRRAGHVITCTKIKTKRGKTIGSYSLV